MGKKTVNLNTIKIEFTCSEAGKQTVDITVYDIMASAQECETCGSHGDITVDVKCACGDTHEIEIRSW